MTSNQRVKYFPNTVPGEKRTEERLNEFISSEKINARSISAFDRGILLLYEEQ